MQKIQSQVAIVLIFALSLSNCDDSSVVPRKTVPKEKAYPALDSGRIVKSLPLYSQWDLQCGRCVYDDSLSNFNSLMPKYTGSNRYQCGQADAGCVAVAMGQILYYWREPGLVDWDLVKDTCATRETAKLMYELGVELQMMYNVDANGSSGVSFDQLENVTNAFNSFGFSSVVNEFDLKVALEELDNDRPIILIACSGFFCHAWIATAYGLDTNNNYHLYMNWGTRFCSWSDANTWEGKGTVFDRKKIMIYGIQPI